MVAADAHAKECLRLASQFSNDVTAALRCRAQFAVMMRQMQSALRKLQRMQAARQRTDVAPAPSKYQRTQPTPPRLDESQATRDPAAPDPAPQAGPLTEAKNYAVLYPLFAARIRASGRLPQAIEAGFDPVTTPPDPAIVETLVNGNSLVLCVLDEIGHDLVQAV